MIELSILTPAVPLRAFVDCISESYEDLSPLASLSLKFEEQIADLPVEHLVFLDNKKRTIGEKRDALLRIAKGRYVAFVDDDDDVSNDYVHQILNASEQNPDVITFEQEATINGLSGRIDFRLGSENEAFKPGGVAKRNAWHVCAWRRELAILSHFPANNYGEDWAFASRLCALQGLKEVHIPKVLHYYRHDEKTTEAPCPNYNDHSAQAQSTSSQA